MEMTYNGTLTMPANFAALEEEEMTYVDGGYKDSGVLYASSGTDLGHYLSTCAGVIYGYMLVYGISGAVTAAAVGAIVGSLCGNAPGLFIGAVIGTTAGLLSGCVLYSWGQECSRAASAAYSIGDRSCHYRLVEHQLTLSISVW